MPPARLCCLTGCASARLCPLPDCASYQAVALARLFPLPGCAPCQAVPLARLFPLTGCASYQAVPPDRLYPLPGLPGPHFFASLLISHSHVPGKLNLSPVTCGDLPLAPACLGSVSSTPWNSWLVSWLSLVMSAFPWRPNTSGWAVMGRLLRYSM